MQIEIQNRAILTAASDETPPVKSVGNNTQANGSNVASNAASNAMFKPRGREFSFGKKIMIEYIRICNNKLIRTF